MLSWKYLVPLAAGTVGLAVWAGYRGELAQVPELSATQATPQEMAERRASSPKARPGQQDKLNELRQLATRHSLSSAESAAAWQIIRNFSAQEVKAAVEEMLQEHESYSKGTLLGMLFYRWGQVDPEAAAELAMQPPHLYSQYGLMSVATSWADRDPEGALRWAAKHDLNIQGYIGNAAGRVLVAQDPAHALDKVLGVFPQAVTGVIMSLANRRDDTPESRQEILHRLAGLTEARNLSTYVDYLMRRIGNDPQITADSLLAELEQAGLPDEQMKRAKARMQSYRQPFEAPEVRSKSQPVVDSTRPLDQQKSYYASWSNNEPEKAVAWAEQNNRPDLVADCVQKQSTQLLRTNWQPGGDPENPTVKRFVQQYESWRKMDAAAAAAWLDTMPGDICKQLSTDHATH